MRRIDPDKIVEIVGAILLIVYLLALWLHTAPVSACTLNAGISKQFSEYNQQQVIPVAGFSKEIFNIKENEPSVEENEQVIVQKSIGIEKDVPPNNSFKSYMDTDTIRSKNTDQYK